MRYIHTILAYGECIYPAVLNGIAVNNSKLMPFSSERENSIRHNRWHNWRMAMKHRNNQYNFFIGMDSDIILPEGAIDTIICDMSSNDCIIWEADEGSKSHGAWAVNNKIIQNVIFEFAGSDRCPLCVWFSKIEEAGFRIKRISIPKLVQVKRQEKV